MWQRTACLEGLDYYLVEIDIMKFKQGQCCPSFKFMKIKQTIYPKEKLEDVPKRMCAMMFISVLFIIASPTHCPQKTRNDLTINRQLGKSIIVHSHSGILHNHQKWFTSYGKGVQRAGIYVYVQLIHFATQQTLTHWKATIFQ